MDEGGESEETAPDPVVWPRIVKLKYPIEFGSERITELTFRRGRLGDIKEVSIDRVPPSEDLVKIAARMCGQLPKVIDRLDGDDAPEVLEIALLFFAKCIPSGLTK